MIRRQISLEKTDYDLAKKKAAALGISVAELIRRAIRDALSVRREGAWMKYAGLVSTGKSNSSQLIDDIVYCSKD